MSNCETRPEKQITIPTSFGKQAMGAEWTNAAFHIKLTLTNKSRKTAGVSERECQGKKKKKTIHK